MKTAFNLQFHINTWAVVGSNEVQMLHYCTWIEFLVNCTLSMFFLIIFFTFTPQSFCTQISTFYTLHFLNSLVPLGLKRFREVTDYFALLRVFKHQSNSNLNGKRTITHNTISVYPSPVLITHKLFKRGKRNNLCIIYCTILSV